MVEIVGLVKYFDVLDTFLIFFVSYSIVSLSISAVVWSLRNLASTTWGSDCRCSPTKREEDVESTTDARKLYGSHGQKLNCVNNNTWTEQVSKVTQQLSPLRYPLCDSRVPNALEKSAQHSYATQKGLTRFPSHKHEGPQNLSNLQWCLWALWNWWEAKWNLKGFKQVNIIPKEMGSLKAHGRSHLKGSRQETS